MLIDVIARKYLSDARFHSLVDMLEAQIAELHLTPEEVRGAAMYAAVRFEMKRPHPFFIDYASGEAEHGTP